MDLKVGDVVKIIKGELAGLVGLLVSVNIEALGNGEYDVLYLVKSENPDNKEMLEKIENQRREHFPHDILFLRKEEIRKSRVSIKNIEWIKE